jgi:predicted regulator of amino acid metabolism with ACT domain
MEEKIAVATVSGKAYYFLVNELKARGIPFLSLTPYENVPLKIDVIITTENERKYIKHPNALVYQETDPSSIIDEAVRLIGGKKVFETLIVGVDPGKTFGVAVVNDGNVLKTFISSSVEETVSKIIEIFSRESASIRVLKVGDRASSYTAELLPLLDAALPQDVIIEIVREAGTSRFLGQPTHERRLKHAIAAVKIAERRGQIFKRKGAAGTD